MSYVELNVNVLSLKHVLCSSFYITVLYFCGALSIEVHIRNFRVVCTLFYLSILTYLCELGF